MIELQLWARCCSQHWEFSGRQADSVSTLAEAEGDGKWTSLVHTYIYTHTQTHTYIYICTHTHTINRDISDGLVREIRTLDSSLGLTPLSSCVATGKFLNLSLSFSYVTWRGIPWSVTVKIKWAGTSKMWGILSVLFITITQYSEQYLAHSRCSNEYLLKNNMCLVHSTCVWYIVRVFTICGASSSIWSG